MVVAGFIIGILALVVAIVALPTAAQMFWGRPKVSLSVHQEQADWGKMLTCRIANQPIDSSFLRKIRVYRQDASDVAVSFTIRKEGKGRETLAEVEPDIRIRSGKETSDTRIPGSRNYRWFSLVVWRNKCNDVVVAGPEPVRPLRPGRYVASIRVSSTEPICLEEVFKVGVACEDLGWC